MYDPNNISTTAIATDTAGANCAKLLMAPSLSRMEKMRPLLSLMQMDCPSLSTLSTNWLTPSISLKALAVQKSGDVYKLVKETVVFESDEDVTYLVFDVTDAGVFDPGTVVYRTELELDETIWSQDVTGDGAVSQGPPRLHPIPMRMWWVTMSVRKLSISSRTHQPPIFFL